MSDSNSSSGKPTDASELARSSQTEDLDVSAVDGPPTQPAEEALNEPGLLTQAREFLVSPAIRQQDAGSKREFLLKKGVSPEDAEKLLEETDVNLLCSKFRVTNCCAEAPHLLRLLLPSRQGHMYHHRLLLNYLRCCNP